MEVRTQIVLIDLNQNTRSQPCVFIENTTEKSPSEKFALALRGTYATAHFDSTTEEDKWVFAKPGPRVRVPMFRYVVNGEATKVAVSCASVVSNLVNRANLFSVENSLDVPADKLFLFVSQLGEISALDRLGFWVGMAVRWPHGATAKRKKGLEA